jgi:hypothetical protein
VAKFGLVFVLGTLAGCASLPEGSVGWILGAPAQEVEVKGTSYRVLKRDVPNVYYAVHRDSLGFVNADLSYVRNAVVAIETVSGCRTVDREQQQSIYIEALVACSDT